MKINKKLIALLIISIMAVTVGVAYVQYQFKAGSINGTLHANTLMLTELNIRIEPIGGYLFESVDVQWVDVPPTPSRTVNLSNVLFYTGGENVADYFLERFLQFNITFWFPPYDGFTLTVVHEGVFSNDWIERTDGFWEVPDDVWTDVTLDGGGYQFGVSVEGYGAFSDTNLPIDIEIWFEFENI